MASRPPVRCPICHDNLGPGQRLEDHLTEAHSKRKLARRLVSEFEAIEETDIAD